MLRPRSKVSAKTKRMGYYVPVLLTSQSSEGPGASLKEPALLVVSLLASAKLSASLSWLPALSMARAMKDGDDGSAPASKNSSPSLSNSPGGTHACLSWCLWTYSASSRKYGLRTQAERLLNAASLGRCVAFITEWLRSCSRVATKERAR